jgi:hypothetical protein
LGREGCAHARGVGYVARDSDVVVLAGDADLANLAFDIVQAPASLAAGTTLTSVTALTPGAAVTASARMAVVAALEAGASARGARRNAIAARGGNQGKN